MQFFIAYILYIYVRHNDNKKKYIRDNFHTN